jgi:hypothetical protein
MWDDASKSALCATLILGFNSLRSTGVIDHELYRKWQNQSFSDFIAALRNERTDSAIRSFVENWLGQKTLIPVAASDQSPLVRRKIMYYTLREPVTESFSHPDRNYSLAMAMIASIKRAASVQANVSLKNLGKAMVILEKGLRLESYNNVTMYIEKVLQISSAGLSLISRTQQDDSLLLKEVIEVRPSGGLSLAVLSMGKDQTDQLEMKADARAFIDEHLVTKFFIHLIHRISENLKLYRSAKLSRWFKESAVIRKSFDEVPDPGIKDIILKNFPSSFQLKELVGRDSLIFKAVLANSDPPPLEKHISFCKHIITKNKSKFGLVKSFYFDPNQFFEEHKSKYLTGYHSSSSNIIHEFKTYKELQKYVVDQKLSGLIRRCYEDQGAIKFSFPVNYDVVITNDRKDLMDYDPDPIDFEKTVEQTETIPTKSFVVPLLSNSQYRRLGYDLISTKKPNYNVLKPGSVWELSENKTVIFFIDSMSEFRDRFFTLIESFDDSDTLSEYKLSDRVSDFKIAPRD